jgi:hypothetical protein
MKTQQDFEKLVVDALSTGNGVLTFAWDLRLGLNYYEDQRTHWLFIATPMPAEGHDSVGTKCQLGEPWELKAKTALVLAERAIQALLLDKQRPFVDGSFQKLERVSDALRHSSCELQYTASWEGAPVPKQPRNEPCACGSGKKFKKCCGGPN